MSLPGAMGTAALCAAVRDARRRLGWTNMRLAWELGYSSMGGVDNLLHHLRTWPSPEQFNRICTVLDIDRLAVLRAAGYLPEE